MPRHVDDRMINSALGLEKLRRELLFATAQCHPNALFVASGRIFSVLRTKKTYARHIASHLKTEAVSVVLVDEILLKNLYFSSFDIRRFICLSATNSVLMAYGL